MNIKLPLYEVLIDEADEAYVSAIALVDAPAIESNFLAFNKAFNFSLNEEKKELLGPAMIPDMQIYRRDGDKEYNVFFSRETIRQIAQVFFKKGLQESLNLFHTDKPANSYIFQSFITDSTMGITAPKQLGNIPDGSWIIGVKVTDNDVWDEIKSGKIKGFSVEGVFQLMQKAHQNHTTEKNEVLNLMQELQIMLNQSAN